MRSKITMLLSLTVCAAASPVAAQSARITVSPTAGWYMPVQNFARVTEDDGSVAVRRNSAPLVGIAVEAKFPSSPVSARVQVAHSLGGDLVAKRLAGEVSCGANCTRFIYNNERLSASSASLVVADAVIRAQSGRLRPFVAAGGGVRRYGFSQSELRNGFADAFRQDVSRFVAHIGAGLEASTGPVTAHVEAGDFFGHVDRGTQGPGMQHDLAVSLGVRFTLR